MLLKIIPLFDDCLTICHRANVTVCHDALASEVETVKVINSDDDKLTKLSDKDFRSGSLQKDTDSLSEDESCEEQDQDDSEIEGEDGSFVIVDSRVMFTSSGRTMRRPQRLD